MMAANHPYGPAQTVIPGACPHDCPDRCSWLVTVEDNQAVKLVGHPEQPFTQGVLCAKVSHYLERVYSPQRLLYPLKRVGTKGEAQFVRVSWDEALDDIAARFKQIIAEDGPSAILPYSYMGNQGVLQSASLDRRFFARLGATQLERRICSDAGGSGILATQGATGGMLPEDIAHSRLIVLWGANTVVTNLHLWPFIQQARRAGAQVVVIDPLKTRTAARADWHLRPLPGTDAALALGMMRLMVDEGLYDADYVAQYTHGFEPLRARLADYAPERVAQITGLTRDDIVRLARLYATTRPAAIRPLVGMEHHAQGAMMFRAIACLPALSGAWRERGGGLLDYTSRVHHRALNLSGIQMRHLQDRSIRTVNMVQLGQALTDSAMAPPIRALVVYNSNPATSAPNQNQVLQGLRRADLFTVVHEQFMTDTARYADYVLPATTQVEHLDLLWSWGHTYVTLNRPAIAPRGEAICNTDLFRRLAARLGFDEPELHESDESLVRSILSRDHPYAEGVTFERLSREGWAPLNLPDDWRPFASGDFPTPSGKCEFEAAHLATRGMDTLPAYAPPETGDDARYPLILMTAKSSLHFLNTSYANLPRQLGAAGEPRLDLHPEDAAPRRICDGDWARIFNERGEVRLRARVGDVVRPGVAAMPFGWWPAHSPGRASANALTCDGLSDLGGGGDWHDTRVEVERLK